MFSNKFLDNNYKEISYWFLPLLPSQDLNSPEEALCKQQALKAQLHLQQKPIDRFPMNYYLQYMLKGKQKKDIHEKQRT